MKRQKLEHSNILTGNPSATNSSTNTADEALNETSENLYYLLPDIPTVHDGEGMNSQENHRELNVGALTNAVKEELLQSNTRSSATEETLVETQDNRDNLTNSSVLNPFNSNLFQIRTTVDNSSQTDNQTSSQCNLTFENFTQTSFRVCEQFELESALAKLQEAQTKIETLNGQLKATKDLLKKYRNEHNAYLAKTEQLEKELEKKHFSESYFTESNEKVKYFTGLDNYKQFEDLLNQIRHSLFKNAKLNPFQQCVMTVMKMKHALSNRDLAMKFDISDRTVGRIFYNCLDPLYKYIRTYVNWPTREEIQISLPTTVKEKLGNNILVLADVFEVHTEKPTSASSVAGDAGNQTNNSAENPGGVKFVICITSQGNVSYISTGIGGKLSNKMVVETCGLLNRLLPNDLILGSRNFEFDNNSEIHCASVKLSQITGQREIVPADYEFKNKAILVCNNARQIAKRICQKYSILLSRIPSELLCIAANSEEHITPLDKIAVVICGLTNYSSIQQQQQTGFVPPM